MNFYWILKMAWRDSRKSRGRLLLYVSSIIMGIAAMTAINSFKENLTKDIDLQAKELLGADMLVTFTQPLPDSILSLFDTVSEAKTHEINFISMVYLPKTDETRLIQVRAIEEGYPYYGQLKTSPESASKTFLKAQEAVIDNALMLQFDIKIGDSLRIGDKSFLIAGSVLEVAGQTSVFSASAPSVFIPKQYVMQTNLLKKGSRVNYRYYYKTPEKFDIEVFAKKVKPFLEEARVNLDTVGSRKRQVSRVFDQMTDFLNLVGFVALLLGCLGVASAVQVYVRTKINQVALLRCLGANSWDVLWIFLVQITVVGFLGSLSGVLLGSLIQQVLPVVFADFLPVKVSTDFSWISASQGLLIGVVISLLFAWIPLLEVQGISPLRVLRASFEESNSLWLRAEWKTPKRWIWLISIILLCAVVFATEVWQMGSVSRAIAFMIGLGIAFGVLALIAWLVVKGVRMFLPTSWNFLWRQGIANLQRPQNQTLLLMTSIGLGTALISTLFFTQEMLLSRFRLSSEGNLANIMLFDIQTAQKEEVKKLVSQTNVQILQEVPVVSGRIELLNGKTKTQIETDTSKDIPKWVFNSELRFSYRDTLLTSEKTVEGIWGKGVSLKGDSILISLNKDFAATTKLKLGDEITFNIQGALITTKVGHLREVDFTRLQSSFMIIFPEGVLENAPQFHILTGRANNQEIASQLQRKIFKSYPNVSVLDLATAIESVQKILDKVNFAIRFMAMFSILTGFLVLASAASVSKFQRIRESVLLRTLGASQKQILAINAIEYGALGFLASLSGVLLALGASSALASQIFEINFDIAYGNILIFCLLIGLLTLTIGLLNSKEVITYPPMTVLREVE
ncbi:MAG: ABC transporter permease [Flammeovirgaceae bacterium]